MDTFIFVLEIIGTIAFAISGAMISIRNKLDIFGVIMLGTVTACGGGFLRDTFLGKLPQSMFTDYIYVIIAASVSLIVFLIFYFKHYTTYDNEIFNISLNILDAIGLGVFVVVGYTVTKSYRSDANQFMLIFYASLTAIGGGLIRDIFVNIIPAIFRKYIYAVATILQAIIYSLMLYLNINQYFSMIFSIVLLVILRFISYKYRLSLPKVKEKEDNLLN
jgi:uncharacterized membrane protein YeiH